MTPDQLKSIFDSNAVILMFLAGVAIKYIPGLAKVSNDAIGYGIWWHTPSYRYRPNVKEQPAAPVRPDIDDDVLR